MRTKSDVEFYTRGSTPLSTHDGGEVNITLEVVGRGLNVKPFLKLMLSNQNRKSAEASSVSWIGSYHVFRPSISAYKLLEKSRTIGLSDRCIAAS